MLQNAYFLARIGADTAENEQHFAEILPKTSNYPTGPPDHAELPVPAARRDEVALRVEGDGDDAWGRRWGGLSLIHI